MTAFFFRIAENFAAVYSKPEGLVESKSTLVQVRAWRQTGDKPLPKAMITQLTGTYMHHLASMNIGRGFKQVTLNSLTLSDDS